MVLIQTGYFAGPSSATPFAQGNFASGTVSMVVLTPTFASGAFGYTFAHPGYGAR